MKLWLVGNIVEIGLLSGEVVVFKKPRPLLLSDGKNLFIKHSAKSLQMGKFKSTSVEIGSLPRRIGKTKTIGEMDYIIYDSAGRNDRYQHRFARPEPLLQRTKSALFIKRRNPKMRFDPNRGIIK